MNSYRIKIEDHEYQVEIEDLDARPVIAIVDGSRVEVWPEEKPEVQTAAANSTRVQSAAAPAAPSLKQPNGNKSGAKSNPAHVRAPIPGTIVEICIHPGDPVEQGDTLVILEAMKMKNAIRSGRGGVIAAVHVSHGQTVRHQDLLLEFKE